MPEFYPASMRELIKRVLQSPSERDDVTVAGWVRTRRDAKHFSFLEINDGSCVSHLQIVADAHIPGYEMVQRCLTGASVRVHGRLLRSQGKGQNWELHAAAIELLGEAGGDFPLQKKGHSLEFLRSIAHLRPRTNLLGAVFRVRSQMAYAIHTFFQERDFVHVHTPIITASDCEGAGEMFRVTTLPLHQHSQDSDDFFAKKAFLTVSGQLEGETFACALSNIYTFGPTFRAENSNTSRHAAEFWMIEPEMAFCDLEGDMDLAEALLKYLVNHALNHLSDELQLFNQWVEPALLTRLQNIATQPFERISYHEALKLLENSGKTFQYPVGDGLNFQSEHERWLTEEYFKRPTIVFDYPKSIKPFYMRVNEDNRTVRAMDVLVPGIGEIIGGSQREERLEFLLAQMEQHQLDPESYAWYADLRRYGTVPHAGFGMGFERLLMLITGMGNIRDVIPFPRTPGHCEF